MRQGYIKLYRKIMDSPVWSDPHYLKLWMYCLMKATHREREVIHGNQVITLQPGQFITGRKILAEDLNEGMKPKQRLNESSWWRYLNNLEKWQMLHIKKTNKYSIVTILKWNEYQEIEHQMNNKRTTDEHQMNTNKNVKNDKNVKNNNYTAKIKDLLQVYSKQIDGFVELNKKYWEVVSETRKTGKIQPSVIYNTMKKWKKYDPVVIEYALKAHIDLHAGKREEYTIGIMRNTSKDEAIDRMNKKNVIPFGKRVAFEYNPEVDSF